MTDKELADHLYVILERFPLEELTVFKHSITAAAARLDALAQRAEARTTHPNGLWTVYYEDPAKPMEIFFGQGAEAAARKRYADAQLHWSCHLLSRVPDPKRPAHAEAADAGTSGPESPRNG